MVRAERESERRRTDEKEHEERWDTVQERACWMATTSATKLEHTPPAEKDKEEELQQEVHSMKMPDPPGPKHPRTEPSVQMVRSQGGREETKDLARPERIRGGSERWQGMGRERETEKAGGSHGGKGGQRKKLSRREGRGGVRGWLKQKKRQEEDRTRFLTWSLAREERGKLEGRRRARS